MNINALMQQAQKMQRDMQKKQNELNSTEFVGESQLVEIVLMGNKSLKSITFKNMESFDKDDLEILQDMIKIAHNDALAKIEKEIKSKMGPYADQLGGLF